MNASSCRYGAIGLVMVGLAGFSASCRNPGGPAPVTGTPYYMAGPGPGDSRMEASPKAPDVQVRIEDFKFVPDRLSVPPGTKVTWVNKDDEPHSATSSEKPKRFDSGALDGEGSFSFTFTDRGSFAYFCKLHPHMTGVIEVR